MAKLSRSFWKGSNYYRKESNDWRNSFSGKVVNAPKSISLSNLKDRMKRSGSHETTDTHSYGRYTLPRVLKKRIA